MKLTVSGIRFSYNGRHVLDCVDFSVRPGMILAVLGENGAGKSTLLKCLNRILQPDRGTVLLDEELLLGMTRKSVARRMAYVPQKHAGSPLTVFDSVLLGRMPHMGWRASKHDYAVVESILSRLGLQPLALRHVSGLSGGEAQKVLIARALAQAPKILLLDEPTSNLDLKNQIDVMDLVRTVVDTQGLGSIVAIHDLNLAFRYADAFLFLKDTTVFALTDRSGLTAEIIEHVYGVTVTMHCINGRTMVMPA